MVDSIAKAARDFINHIVRDGVPIRVTSTYRTFGQQMHQRQRWEQGLSRYPADPAGYSIHELAKAIDIGNSDDLSPDQQAIVVAEGLIHGFYNLTE